ncbi:MAG: Fic family protein [Defluviitaleaceae bacterium]|nr:Fic family protein [Defluviitaleaceae bacterium]
MENKFNMPVDECVFYAKRNIVDYIWKSARMEGIAVTYPDTDAIYNGLVVQGFSVDDIVVINNLKHAWRFMLDHISLETDFSVVCEINRTIGAGLIHRAGFVRNIPVNNIGGTDWKPDMPIESQIKKELTAILKMESVTDRALSLALYLMRKQIFMDGNKRTALLASNHIMIRHGAGILTVPIERQHELFALLIEYYESGNNEKAKKYLYDFCIEGY